MNFRRYGSFRITDYWSAWIGIVFLCVISSVGIYRHEYALLCLFSIAFAIFILLSIVLPNREKFSISKDEIIIKRGKEVRKIVLPTNPILIISYADVCSLLDKKVSYANQTYRLKGRYAISILRNMPLELALKRLHQNFARQYTLTTIEVEFDRDDYIYGFVGEPILLDWVLADREYQLIIPESLKDQLEIREQKGVYIDYGY